MGYDKSELNLKNLLHLNPELQQFIHDDKDESAPKKSNRGNIKHTDLDGETYDSGKEAEDARNFVAAVNAGEYILYKHHVRITLPSGNKLVLDHVAIDKDFKVIVADTKAFDNKTQKYRCERAWKCKAKEFKARFGFDIKII